MAERQAAHRQEMEKKQLQSEITDSRLGVIFAFILCLATIASGTYCILNGFSISGTLIAGTGLTGLVGVFIYGTRQNRKEKEKRVPNKE